MFKDDYREMLEKVVEEKIHEGAKKAAHPRKKEHPTNVVDLVSVLQESINATKGKARPALKTLKKAA